MSMTIKTLNEGFNKRYFVNESVEDNTTKVIPYVAFSEDDEAIVISEIICTKNKDDDYGSFWEVSFGPFDDYEEFNTLRDCIDHVKQFYDSELFVLNPKSIERTAERLKLRAQKLYPDLNEIEIIKQSV